MCWQLSFANNWLLNGIGKDKQQQQQHYNDNNNNKAYVIWNRKYIQNVTML